VFVAINCGLCVRARECVCVYVYKLHVYVCVCVSEGAFANDETDNMDTEDLGNMSEVAVADANDDK